FGVRIRGEPELGQRGTADMVHLEPAAIPADLAVLELGNHLDVVGGIPDDGTANHPRLLFRLVAVVEQVPDEPALVLDPRGEAGTHTVAQGTGDDALGEVALVLELVAAANGRLELVGGLAGGH